MGDLLRELAPISDKGWEEVEAEAKRTLKLMLAARKVVDFRGPLGWAHSAVDLCRTDPLPSPVGDGIRAVKRRVLPLVEYRVPFELSRAELEGIARGSRDPDLDPVTDAARTIAVAENRAVFHGFAEAGIEGIATAAADAALTLTDDHESYPRVVAQALSRLHDKGVDGPFGIVLGPAGHTGLAETVTPAGYPVLQHVRRLLDGPIIWAPGLDGAIVLSLRGGDFELTVGQDLSIGYLSHDAEHVRLYLQESFAFQVLAPEAAVPLHYETAARAGHR